jgi:hypothetical protein
MKIKEHLSEQPVFKEVQQCWHIILQGAANMTELLLASGQHAACALLRYAAQTDALHGLNKAHSACR